MMCHVWREGWIVNEYTQRRDRLINRLMDKILTSDSSASFLSSSVYEILAEVEGFCEKATNTVLATFHIQDYEFQVEQNSNC